MVWGWWVPAEDAPQTYVNTPNILDETPRPAPVNPKIEMVPTISEAPPVTWRWGMAYPCCGYKLQTGMKCGGLMERKGRRFRFERRGRLWNRFVCRRCGREASDWATE